MHARDAGVCGDDGRTACRGMNTGHRARGASTSRASSDGGDEDARRTLALLQTQLRAQAREIARLQREVVDAHRERDALAGEVMKPLDVRFKDCVRDLIRETTWFRLRSVEETIEVNAYESATRAEFELAGARSVMEAKFPDLNAVKVKTREDIGGIGFEFTSRPFKGELLAFKARAHLEKLLGVAKAPTLAVAPSPPFPWNGKTKWNPALETSLDIDGVAIDAKYTMVRDSVSVDHLDFEVSTTHEEYGDLSVQRVSQHTVAEEQLDVNPGGCWRASWSQRKGEYDLAAHFKTDKGMELELSAGRQFAKHFRGKATSRVAARELELQIGYEFTEELKGWEVVAKSVLSTQGLQNPTFQLNHAWEF
jgi:hypothetical protein